jgi:catechol 2,3-dioxygenase-like lactoylglutathione lyase family enzyme
MALPGVTPRIRHVLETALHCDDLPRTAAFYQRLLGATPMLSSDRLVALDAGNQTVLLVFQRGNTPALETPGGTIPGHDGDAGGHLAFAIAAADLPAWEARLAALGIAVESRVTWEAGGLSVYFRDPDGRSVELATPGIWPSY